MNSEQAQATAKWETPSCLTRWVSPTWTCKPLSFISHLQVAVRDATLVKIGHAAQYLCE